MKDINLVIVGNSHYLPLRFVLMRLHSSPPRSPEVVELAGRLEEAVRERPVNMVVRQQAKDMAFVYLEVCNSDLTDRRLQALQQDGFDAGPQPSSTVFLTEGQMVEVRFRGNITNQDQAHIIRFAYNSNLFTARKHIFVREVDRFGQRGLEYFRGHVQFWVQVAPPQGAQKLLEVETPSGPPRTSWVLEAEGDEAQQSMDAPRWTMLNELPITLPKVRYQATLSRC